MLGFRIGLGLLLSLLSPLAWAENGQPERALAEFLKKPAVRGGRIAVLVEGLETRAGIVGHNAEGLMVPASNQKLLIAGAALSHWGPAHHFETEIYVERPPRGGVLDGRLWIRGVGDPTLVSETIWKLAEEIRLLGIQEIRGGIGIDNTYFDRMRFHPDWGPRSTRAYHAATSAFAVNYSSFRVDITGPDEAKGPVMVQVAPNISYFRISSDALAVTKNAKPILDLKPLPDGSGERVLVHGTVRAKGAAKTYWRAVALPEIYAASLLRAQLQAQGVRVAGTDAVTSLPEGVTEFHRYKGESLGQIVSKLNKFSNNFIAEQLMKLLGAEMYGVPGSWEKGARAVRAYLTELGIDESGAIVADGSGLSPRNRVAASTLVAVIRDASARFGSGPEFLASLPLAGRDGTLKDRMVDDVGAVRGKTGHLKRVASLSGIATAGLANDQRWVFSVMVNGARGGSEAVDLAIDEFLIALTQISTPSTGD